MADETQNRLDDQEAIIAYQSMEIDALRIALGLVVDATMTSEQRKQTAEAVKAMRPRLVEVMKTQVEDASSEEVEDEVEAMVGRILEHFERPDEDQPTH